MQDTQQVVRDLAKQLIARQWMLCTAESCTGGLIAKTCTDLAGSSGWFERGFVTYSNRSKSDLLGVDQQLLERYGAVSEPVATAMAAGALANSAAQVAVAVTGIAGPQGGTEEKPVGTVWFGFAVEGRLVSERCLFDGDREQIRNLSRDYVLNRLRSLV